MLTLPLVLLLTAAPTEAQQLPKEAPTQTRKFAADCDARGAQSCLELGSWYFQRGDTEHAATLFTRACDLSKPESNTCREASVRRSREPAGFAEKSVERAPFPVRQHAISCDRYDPRDCYDTASWLLNRTEPLQVRRGADVLKYGCEKHDSTSCSELSRFSDELAAGCRQGNDSACDGAKWFRVPRPREPVAKPTDGVEVSAATPAAPTSAEAAPRTPIQRCLAALDRAAASQESEARMLVGLGCKGIFKNADFNRAWYAVMNVETPQMEEELLLEGARESYCRAWKRPTPDGCTNPKHLTADAAPKFRAVFERILDTDFQGDERQKLKDGFARSWDKLFPSH